MHATESHTYHTTDLGTPVLHSPYIACVHYMACVQYMACVCS